MLSRPSAAQKHQKLSLVATINLHITHMVDLIVDRVVSF
jgi:hypothetical protein